MSEPKWQEHKGNATGFTEVPDAHFADEATVSEEALSGPTLHRKIVEVMERRPDDWWREFQKWFDDTWARTISYRDILYSIDDGLPIRHHPPKVKLSGEVEPEVIETAKELAQDFHATGEAEMVAKALLGCVETSYE